MKASLFFQYTVFMKFKFIVLLLFSLFLGNLYAQTAYNKNCLLFETMIGNDVYGVWSGQIGGEFKVLNHQKIGFEFGSGINLGIELGGGLYISPYEWRKFDFLVSLDYVRMFGQRVTFENEYDPSDIYSFENINMLIPCLTFRRIVDNFTSFQLTFGKAFPTSTPSYQLISGNNIPLNEKNLKQTLSGSFIFSYGLAFRIRNWKKDKINEH